MNTPNLVQELYRKGHLIEPDAVGFIDQHSDKLFSIIDQLNPELHPIITLAHLQELIEEQRKETGMQVIFNYNESFELRGGVQDFHSYFSDRYQKISDMLKNRPELEGLVSINKTQSLKREDASMIGMVTEVAETRAGNYLLEIEDQTGSAKVVISKESEVYKKMQEIVYDEVLGITGRTSRELIFGKNLVFPGVPQIDWPEQPFSIALISDTHVGSKMFLEDAFQKFVAWLSGDVADPAQVELSKSVKYLVVAGDLVDGCGVYKGQKKELLLPNIEDQYEKFAELISQIPKNIQIIISPGNHDATREAEPQPAIPETFAKSLYKIKNVTMVSNPSYIKLGDIILLVYHGASLDSLINSITALRKIGYDQPHKAMEILLRKRHLCPIYGESTRIFPETEDNLVISKVPHILHMGHVHSIGASNVRGVRLVNSGTFQRQTPFQAKIGHHPTPGIVPIIDGSGKITMVDFAQEIDKNG